MLVLSELQQELEVSAISPSTYSAESSFKVVMHEKPL